MPKPSKDTAAKVRQVRSVLNLVQSYLDAQYFHPRRGSYVNATVLTLLSKSLALARSTVCLVQGGFDEEAFGVSRPLLEEIDSYHRGQDEYTILLVANW